MERTNIYISDTDEQVMQKVLSSISSVIFSEKKYDDILLKRYQEMKEQFLSMYLKRRTINNSQGYEKIFCHYALLCDNIGSHSTK